MLLDFIIPYIESAANRGRVTLSKYDNYLQVLKVKQALFLNEFMLAPGIRTYGVRLLESMLESIDTLYLGQLSNDVDRYTRYWTYAKDTMDDFLGINYGKVYKTTFIKQNTDITKEYIIPVENIDPLSYLPMNKPYDEWSKINPVRLLSHDSLAYTLDLRNDIIRFRREQPMFAVIGIDTVALGMKYYKYSTEVDPETTILDFIHSEVMPYLTTDMINTWLMNTILRLFDTDNINDIKFDDKLITDNSYNYVGQQYLTGMGNVWKHIETLKLGKDPNTFFNSVNMMNGTMGDHILQSYNDNQIAYLQQYYWQIYLRDMKSLELVFKVYETSPEHMTTKNIFRILRYRIMKVSNTKFYNHVRDEYIRTYITEHLTKLQEKYL